MKNLLFFFILMVLGLFCSAQGNSSRVGFVSNNDVFGTRNFVENIGQYDHSLTTGHEVLFGYEHNRENIYFTPSGVVYKHNEARILDKEEYEEIEKGKAKFPDPGVAEVRMNWLNCNSDIQIQFSKKQAHYFTGGNSKSLASCFKTLLYKNVYDNIDVEFKVPDNKEFGIKYSFILHPGANPSDIKIKYTGDIKSISEKRGSVFVKTLDGVVQEHPPITYDASGKILKSEFRIESGAIKFVIENYKDSVQTVIDPWVTAITSFTPNTSAYDVDYDSKGNLYVYGGGGVSIPSKVSKYDPLGNLLWT